MRVLHLVSATHARGAELTARNLVDALAEVGIGGSMAALVPGAPSSGEVDVDAVLVPNARDRFRWFPAAVVNLRRELARRPADLVLAHGAHAAFVAAALPGGPPVVWHRILESPRVGSLAPQQLAKRLLVRRIRGAIAITDRTADEVRGLGFRGPVWQVPNHRPAPPEPAVRRHAGEALRAELRVPPDALVVATVGHLVAQKDPLAAVAVVAAVLAAHPEVHLVMAGDGPLRARTEQRARELLPPGQVHFLGHRSDVTGVFAAADLLLSTSRSDSMPGTAIEAQLAGCPVVAFPVDGIDQVIANGVTGVVTAAPDAAMAAQAIGRLLDDPSARAAMAKAAPTRARGLTTSRVVERYAAIIRSAVRDPLGPDQVRVLHVLPDLGVGGAEQALAVLAHVGLGDPTISQVVAAVGGARRPLSETVHGQLQAAGVGYCDLGVGRRPSRSLVGLAQASRRLGRLARRLDIDVVDAALFDATIPTRLAPGRFRRVTHLVNTPYAEVVGRAAPGRRWRRGTLRRVDAATAGRDDAVVAITEAVATASRPLLRLRRGVSIDVIPRGVDVASFTSAAVEREAWLVVSVGRLVPQKGHDTLIRAVAAARAEGHPLRLVIMGEGPAHDDLVTLVQDLGLGDAVELAGPVADVRPLLARCGAFALASRWEGQSNAVLEAMAMGCAVVVGDVPALREVVGDAGRLVSPDDVGAWAAELAAIAGDPRAHAHLGQAARAQVEARYDARSRAADLFTRYRLLRR